MGELLFAGARADVTPPPGFPLAGYVARGDSGATGSHDALEVSALWLSTAEDPGVLWLCLDSLAVDANLVDLVAESAAAHAGVPADRVVVCASHTHAAPLGWTTRLHPAIPGARDEHLVSRLMSDVDGLLRSLPGRREPSRLAWCAVPADGVGTNRNRPDGPHDNTTGVLAVGTPDRVDGLLFDYASHPTVLGPENLTWSADWPGVTRRALTSALPDHPTVGFLQGAAGDASPRFTRRGRGHPEVERIGVLLADTILTALDSRSRFLPPVAPVVHRVTVSLPARRAPGRDDVRRLVTRAERDTPCGDSPADRIRQTRLEGARALAGLPVDLPTTFDLPLSVVALGDIAWVHLPVELFGSLGLRIRAASPFPVTRVVGYSDGYFGYVADAEGHEGHVYEAMISLFDAPAGDLLVTHAVELLRRARASGVGGTRLAAGG
ncbi:hypothetical protein [Actinosynnema sp. NPDC020468]|uniref:hypothetical protein n=1 Tax=Actinosynnema sp. NPDC020468 TaxID=3154488 RepID=UPI0033E2DA52